METDIKTNKKTYINRKMGTKVKQKITDRETTKLEKQTAWK